MNRRGSVVLLLLFILSGAAGLVYEVVWARQLVLVFGNTTQAVSAILTGFFGGLALGSAVGGRLADRTTRPLRLYGVIEILLVVVVLLTPVTFRLLHDLYRGLYPVLVDVPGALALVRFALALVALAPATVLMGATLPTLTRALARSGESLSRAFGRLYAANTLGAIVGTLIAGFVLIELLGLTGALVVGASASGVAGLGALALDRTGRFAPREAAVLRQGVTSSHREGAGRTRRLALAIAFVSGLTALAYQTLWTRLLAAGTGNSTYVFSLILALFLTGLAIGALAFSVLRPHPRRALGILAVSQVLVAALAVGGMSAITDRTTLEPLSALGNVTDWLTEFAWTVALVVLPPTIVMGLAFPASSALMADEAGREGAESGLLIGANTFGTVIGTFVVPFVVIPLVGSPVALGLVALVNAITGVALALTVLSARSVRAAGSLAGLAVAGVIVAALAGGSLFVNPTARAIEARGGQVFETAEDEIAAVEAGSLGARQLWVTGTSMTLITVDTKFMPLLPLALRPDAERALVIAFGMGTAYRSGLIAGLEVDAVELVPSVPRMFRWFYPDASTWLEHPDGRVIVADGRNHVDLERETFDFVIVDPPPPIETAGVSVISSVEFYEAAKRRLVPGGVMMQWVPYGQTLDEYLAHVRSFARVFPNVRVIFGPGGYGTYMLGSDGSVDLTPEALSAVLARPGVLEDVNGAPDSRGRSADEWVAVLMGNTWLREDEVERVVGDGPLVTDDGPYPEYFLLRRLGERDVPLMNPGTMFELRDRLLGAASLRSQPTARGYILAFS